VPVIFELFGYPLSDQSLEAQQNRQRALCPFMGEECDGGGNRELSRVDLTRNSDLRTAFSQHPGNTVAAGVCSIQVVEGASPWIVCPRRLLSLGRESAGVRSYQGKTEAIVLNYLSYPPGTRLGVWPEVKIKSIATINGVQKLIDYTFDYIVMPVGSVLLDSVANLFPNITYRRLLASLNRAGYTLSQKGGIVYIEDFPMGIPSIVEIMTSSTSGGNKRTRTTISAAFEDAMLGVPHQAPGINYRQVWARMVSQLIVKSEFALGWGGKTLWIVQDKLLEYINSSTALTLKTFLSDNVSDVNMLSFSYSSMHQAPTGVIDLADSQLYAGPISSVPPELAATLPPSIQDITRAPFLPPLETLIALLAARAPVNQVVAP